MAAVPSIGRASAVEPRPAGPEAQATSLLYERYARQIFNFCLHRLGNREEAEDAAQTTFLNAFRGIQRGVTPELEQAWLFKIAENVCLTRHRSSFRRRRVESPSDLDVLQEIVPSPQRDAETLIRLPDALVEMPEQQRRALLLREWQGLSYREIAEELELSQPAVETLLFRARRSLANALTEAPERKHRARLRSGIDIGGILVAVKSAFAGGAAVKVAAVAAVATTTAVAGHKVQTLDHAQARPAEAAATRLVVSPAPRTVTAAAVAATTEASRATATRRPRKTLPARVGPVRATSAPTTSRAPQRPAAPPDEAPAAPAPAVDQAEHEASPAPQPVLVAQKQSVQTVPSAGKLDRGLSSDVSTGSNGKLRGNGKAADPPAATPPAAPGQNGNGKGNEEPAPAQPAPEVTTEPAPAAAPAAEPEHPDNGRHLGRVK